MATGVMALLTALLVALPKILTMIETYNAAQDKQKNDLQRHNIDELTAGADKLRNPPPV